MKLKKRGKGLKFLMSFLLLAGMAFHSCMDEGIIDAPTWHQVVEFGDDALVRDAKAMVDETQGELAMPDMFKTMGKVQTRSSGSAPQTLASGCFTFDWDAAQSFHEENGTVLIVPIKMMQNMAIWRFTVINNKRKAEQTPMHSVLYIKKFKRTGNIMGRVMSYAPSRKYMKKQAKMKKQNERLEWYNPDHTDYSGLLLISSLDGTLIHGYNYEEGHRQFMFRPNVAHQHNHSHEATPATRAVAEADSCIRHDHTTENKLVSPKRTVFSMRMISSTSAISSYSFDNETYVQPGCVICGKDPYTCVCNTIVGDICDDCGKLPENCICICPICENKECTCPCPFCLKSPCECNTENCLFCGKYPCECEYNTGGGGGSSSNNGNNNSSNNWGDNNQNSSGNTNTTGITVANIIQATKNSVKKVIQNFGYKKAYCNQGVNCAFQELVGSTVLSNMNANTMVRYWISSSDWTEITLAEAQAYANNGYFTVAGWINTSLRADGTEQSGHVVVIVPGETQKGWGGMDLPCAMDTGGGMREERQKLSLSFGSDKKDGIRFFHYNK